MNSCDLISTYNSIFYRLFSLSFVIPRVPSQDLKKSDSDEFIDVFASDAEEKHSVPEEHGNQPVFLHSSNLRSRCARKWHSFNAK